MHRVHAVNRCITQLHVQVRIPLMSPEPEPVEKIEKRDSRAGFPAHTYGGSKG